MSFAGNENILKQNKTENHSLDKERKVNTHHDSSSSALPPAVNVFNTTRDKENNHDILGDHDRHLTLNGRGYFKLNLLGKGGSSAVYKILSKAFKGTKQEEATKKSSRRQ